MIKSEFGFGPVECEVPISQQTVRLNGAKFERMGRKVTERGC